MRAALVLPLLLALPPCASADDPKPKADFTLTAEEYAKEYLADKKAFAGKYKGKTVELTATVWNMRLWGGNVILLNGFWKDAPKGLPTLVAATPAKPDGRLRALARGQRVTVRGKQ